MNMRGKDFWVQIDVYSEEKGCSKFKWLTTNNSQVKLEVLLKGFSSDGNRSQSEFPTKQNPNLENVYVYRL